MDMASPLFRTGEGDPLEGGGVVYQDHNKDVFWSFWGPRGDVEDYEEYDYTIFTVEVAPPEALPEIFPEDKLIQRADSLGVTVERMVAMASSEEVTDRVLFLIEMREVIEDLELDPHPRTVTAEHILEFPLDDLPSL